MKERRRAFGSIWSSLKRVIKSSISISCFSSSSSRGKGWRCGLMTKPSATPVVAGRRGNQTERAILPQRRRSFFKLAFESFGWYHKPTTKFLQNIQEGTGNTPTQLHKDQTSAPAQHQHSSTKRRPRHRHNISRTQATQSPNHKGVSISTHLVENKNRLPRICFLRNIV